MKIKRLSVEYCIIEKKFTTLKGFLYPNWKQFASIAEEF